MYKFADVMKDLITESGKSLRTIGQESDIPHSQLSRYVNGTIPKFDVSIKIASYFNCTLDYLFGLTDQRGMYVDNYDISKFVSRYESALEENKITHWKFSHKYGISESGIRLWKKGILPKMETIIIIAKSLDCSIDYLLGK